MANRISIEALGLLVLSCSGQLDTGLSNAGGANGTSISVGSATSSTGGTSADGEAGGNAGTGGISAAIGGTVGVGGSASSAGGGLNTGGSITGLGGMPGECAVGTANCDGLVANGCEVDLRVDLQNCGSCGNRCGSVHGLSVCVNGYCDSNECWPFANCDNNYANGCETSLQTSPQNCGACGVVCASGICVAGVCQASQ